MVDYSSYEISDDQYKALSKLSSWYDKANSQFFLLSSPYGTGGWDIIQYFLYVNDISPEEVMYLTMDQKRVMELAHDQLHAYYINCILYRYEELVDVDTIPYIGKEYDGRGHQ